MELIAANIRINAKPTEVLTALTTTDGVRQGWTDDVEMSRDIGAPPIFRFDTIEVTFLIDRIDCHGIEMTCVSHKTRPEWPDTHLAFRVIPDRNGTYVDVLHDGYRDKNGCYADVVRRHEKCDTATISERGRAQFHRSASSSRDPQTRQSVGDPSRSHSPRQEASATPDDLLGSPIPR